MTTPLRRPRPRSVVTDPLIRRSLMVESVTTHEMKAIVPEDSEGGKSDLKKIHDCIVELTEKNKAASSPKQGNPAVVGLAAFGLTTIVLQFHNIGWMTSLGPVVWLGLIFGGLAQFIAGIQEFNTGNNFGYSAFTTYGAFWISLALMLIGDHFDIYKVSYFDKGLFLLAFMFYTLVMLIGAIGISIAHAVVFFTLFLGFLLLVVAHFGNKESMAGVTIAAGWVLIFCALSAWYLMLHIIYADIYKRPILPIGKPLLTYFAKFNKSNNRRLTNDV